MRTTQQWLDEYGESHQNPFNKMTHWVCVPLIVWSVLAMLWSIPLRLFENSWINVATVVYVAALVFYFRLSLNLGLGMLVVGGLMLYICRAIEMAGWPLFYVALSVFVLAWIGQFYGHKVEGKKPSFIKDIVFLLIGPIWLLSFVYKKAGIAF